MGRGGKFKIVENVIQCKRAQISLKSENPFTWLLMNRRMSYMINSEEAIEQWKYKQENCFVGMFERYDRFVYDLCMMYEYFYSTKKKEAFEKAKEMEKEYTYGTPKYKEDFYMQISEAILHVITSSQAYLMFNKGFRLEEHNAKKVNLAIENMNAKDKAAMYGIKSSFLMEYGDEYLKECLTNIEAAISLDRENPHWYYMKGNILGRIRHAEGKIYGQPGIAEFQSYEFALQHLNHPLYKVAAAKMLHETAAVFYRTYHGTEDWAKVYVYLVRKLNNKATSLYMETLKVTPATTEIMFKCAEGFINIPFCDKNILQYLIEESLKLNPEDPYGNYVAALYYERIKQDIDMAKKHLNISVEKRLFLATLDLLRLDCQTKNAEKVDVTGRLMELAKQNIDRSWKAELNCQLASYYIFVKHNLHAAITCLYEVLHYNAKCEEVMFHKSLVVPMKGPVCLYDVLVNEIYLKLRNTYCSYTEMVMLHQFIHKLSHTDVYVNASFRNPISLRKKILVDTDCYNWWFFQKFSVHTSNKIHKEFMELMKINGAKLKEATSFIQKHNLKNNTRIGAKITLSKNKK